MIGGTPPLFLYAFMAWTGTLTESGTHAGSSLIRHSMPDPRQFYYNEGLQQKIIVVIHQYAVQCD